MSLDPEKVRMIKDWPDPEDKSAVKSFLQSVQFGSTFMSSKGTKTYIDITRPLRNLTKK